MVIGECIRQSVDIAARYGGEEFAVVLPNADIVRARDVAERIRERVAGLDMRHAESGRVTLSIGIAFAPAGYGHDADALIASADQALYAAKRAGRNRVELAG
jgi:diguanylate cyclase (GGDEF)-like protein